MVGIDDVVEWVKEQKMKDIVFFDLGRFAPFLQRGIEYDEYYKGEDGNIPPTYPRIKTDDFKTYKGYINAWYYTIKVGNKWKVTPIVPLCKADLKKVVFKFNARDFNDKDEALGFAEALAFIEDFEYTLFYSKKKLGATLIELANISYEYIEQYIDTLSLGGMLFIMDGGDCCLNEKAREIRNRIKDKWSITSFPSVTYKYRGTDINRPLSITEDIMPYKAIRNNKVCIPSPLLGTDFKQYIYECYRKLDETPKGEFIENKKLIEE